MVASSSSSSTTTKSYGTMSSPPNNPNHDDHDHHSQQQQQQQQQHRRQRRQRRQSTEVLSETFRRRSIDATHELSILSHEQASSSFRPSSFASSNSISRPSISTTLRKRRSRTSTRMSHDVENDHNDNKSPLEVAPSSPPPSPSSSQAPSSQPKSPPPSSSTSSSLFLSSYYNRHIQTIVSLAVFSYVGEFIRWFTEEFFGLACHKPTSWTSDEVWPVCTTAPGTTESTGGAMFTDLPANMLGCFIMGLMVSGDGESIAVNIPVAMFSRSWSFQQWTITHVGIRTGLCGSLTTFASWNTQMVIMICGGRGTTIGTSQWVSALFGYIVGLFVSSQMYVWGRDVAFVLSRWNNPNLAREADCIVDRKEIGVLVNRDLPDFERRFLHDILIDDKTNGGDDEEESRSNNQNDTIMPDGQRRPSLHRYGQDAVHSFYTTHVHHLQNWKTTTDQHRQMNNTDYVDELHEIEKNLLMDGVEPRQELLDIARDAGWDVDALRNWRDAIDDGLQEDDDEEEKDVENLRRMFWDVSTIPWEAVSTLIAFVTCTGLLIWGVLAFDGTNSGPSKTYQTQFLSALVSPFGTLTRWYLSRLNGTIKRKNWEWLPIGTLAANVFGSIISALMAAISVDIVSSDDHVASLFVGAIKTGYAGCLSTVSTYVTETVGLFRALPRYWWGYYYSFGSLFLGLVVGLIAYAWSVA